ncbi:MAG TPA: hypothetical protein VFZ59_03160 [Verrucomicrobiae bacterium]|nr:hypothetical protein [Verrucomicrobiae bacterium]
MTPLRQKETLQAELVGLESLLASTPEDPLATPLLRSRIEGLRSEIKKTDAKTLLVPEAEIFFGSGPVIGSQGIDAKFAGQVLDRYQDMVTNHFAAKFHGALRRTGRRKGEANSRLFLTALPRGSFGLQLSQPHVDDFVTASQVSETMQDITGLVEAAAKDDASFEETLSGFHGRVLIPLQKFLETLKTAEADCRMAAGMRQVKLKQEDVKNAFERVASAETLEDNITLDGIFYGALVRTGRFDFEPRGQTLVTGWLADEVSEEQAIQMDQLTGKAARAVLRTTTISTKTGKRRPTYELLKLEAV